MSHSDNSSQPLEQLRQIRIDKITRLNKLGINAYPQFAFTKKAISEVVELKQDEIEVIIAGRVLAKRGHGKLYFFDISDFSGKIQVVVKADVVSTDAMALVELIDIGDFLKIDGKTYTTNAGEFSVLATDVKLLSKSIRPLPNKWEGFKDQEEKYRQRYADMILDETTFNTLKTRSKIVQVLRRFFLNHDFYEVNTPVLQEMYGGASAKPFTTRHNALDADFYLRISPELYLKRLIVGGFEKVFEFTVNFRNEGLSRWHNPEFQNIEFYWAYSDYNQLMEFTTGMFRNLVKEVKGDLRFTYDGKEVDFSKDLPRVTYRDAILEHANIDYEKFDTEEKLRDEIKSKNLLKETDLDTIGYANLLDVLYKRTTRPKLIGPLYVIDYPAEMIALAKRKDDDPKTIATFQLLILGEEFVKAYNEVNNPLEQRARWEETEKQALKGQEEAERLDEDYINALEYGMPPTAGWGLGLERTIALLTDRHNIKDVMFFPTLRPRK